MEDSLKISTFPKSEKLCNFHRIQLLFREGSIIKKYPLKLLYLPIINENFSTQVLISVPKRKFKRAVHRNRIKRLIRESYRNQKHLLLIQKPLSLAFVYMGEELISYTQMHFLVGELLKQLSLMQK